MDAPANQSPRPCLPLDFSRVAVVLPALDEAESVAASVAHWREIGCGLVRVVDNGSTDNTSEVARKAGAEVLHEPVRGYGAAAWCGAGGLPENITWILFSSADGSDYLDETSLEDFRKAVADGACLVIGDRVTRPDARATLNLVQRFGNAFACTLIRLGWGVSFRDLGSLRLIRRDTFDWLALQDRAFGWNIEMQVRSVEAGIPIREVPVGYRPRQAGSPKISGSLRGVVQAGSGIVMTLARLWTDHKNRPARCLASLTSISGETKGG